jgi:YfiH family protein
MIAEAPWGEDRPRADGVVTLVPGLVCGALAADCAPVLMADADRRIVGAVHAGWRGALEGVIAAAVEAMVSLGARRDRIVAAVGPCIAQASYEVGEDFLAAFETGSPDWARFFDSGVKPGKYQFDLPGFVLHRLAEAGVENAEWLARDTCAEEAHFYSNRRAVLRHEADYGRLLSAITLEA